MAKKSAHDSNNSFFTGDGDSTLTPWAHAWTAQSNVTAAIVKATGGTYSLIAHDVEEIEEAESKQPKAKKNKST